MKPTREKQKGIVAHFNQSTGVDGLNGLHKCQRSCNLPEHHPVSAVATRWSSDHDQMEWFRYEQRAVQLYDVNHSRKAGDAYRQHQLGLEDWQINEQGTAVLQGAGARQGAEQGGAGQEVARREGRGRGRSDCQ